MKTPTWLGAIVYLCLVVAMKTSAWLGQLTYNCVVVCNRQQRQLLGSNYSPSNCYKETNTKTPGNPLYRTFYI